MTEPYEGQALSPREVEVLRLVAEGLSNKQIAGALGIKADTVKNHNTHIQIKLGTLNRAHSVYKGVVYIMDMITEVISGERRSNGSSVEDIQAISSAKDCIRAGS